MRRVTEPNGDPTLDEMREYLTGAGLYEPMGEDGGVPEMADLDPDAEAAIYFFAVDYHGGASSNLYCVLSVESPYKPGSCSLEDEGEAAELCYAALVARFIPESVGVNGEWKV